MEAKSEVIAKLQREILDLQGLRVPLDSELEDTGLGMINKAFPNHTFPVSAVHEFISHTKEEAAATTGFMTGLLKILMRKGVCLWVSTNRLTFPPGLKAFGISPDQVIFVDVPSNKEGLWTIEEGLKCERLSAVVGDISNLSFVESRRLQLAVEKSHVTGLIHRSSTIPCSNSACVSRWHVQPLESIIEEGMPGVGYAKWRVELLKIRNGRPGIWQVGWTEQGFHIAAAQHSSAPSIIRKAG
ncbi:MAG TPA: hypothetical protein VM802_30705 [Chitinophaga sp.]|uniref:ImuA family protein n=1 Tax=Chitinophaga sp. TaxID=1869181 RepID=UPI002CC327DC|nr:Error-prone repair protein ImuA [Chitinophaga sp.]HVI49276.1 hypothetical protein [Chitinophaga sp.]